jgi:hypothetical protein
MKRTILILIGIVALGLLGVAGFMVLDEQRKDEVGCTMEAKICPDGTAVGRSGPDCSFTACPSAPNGNGMIRITSPEADVVAGSPVTIRGEARGGWYFEGSFPVRVVDGNEKVLGTATARALGEWMTTEFVPFEATISFAAPETATGTLILEKDNPSGLPENADEFRLPVKFAPETRTTADWREYADPDLGIALLYEPTLTVEKDGANGVRFWKWGPTQKGQTEMYDGIIVSFRKTDFSGSLDSFLATRLKEFADAGTVTESLSPRDFNGRPAWSFSSSGLGDFDLTYVPIDADTVLEISVMAPDPTAAGFEELTKLLLSTVTFRF